jgi:sigma-B regulation protein RsbU (phosphoserine phosphatase)
MMADLRFSGKWTEKVASSLALRVFVVSTVLLALPLLLASLFIYNQDSHLRINDLRASLQIIADTKAGQIEQTIHDDVRNLSVLETLIDLSEAHADPADLNPLFQEIAYKEKFSSLFYLTLTPGGHTVCVASNRGELVGQEDLFSEELKQILRGSYGGFAATAPDTGEKEFFVVKRVYPRDGSTAAGIIIASHTIKNLIETISFTKGFDRLQLALLTKDKHPIVSSEAHEESLSVESAIPRTSLWLEISVPQKTALEGVPSHLLKHLVTLLAFILVLGGLSAAWLTRLMSKPLRALGTVMENVEKGDLHARFHPARLGFEINLLGTRLNQMVDALLKQMKKTKQEQLARELLEGELSIGREIQESLLPKEMPDLPHLQIASGFLSAKEVGGDFYDILIKKDSAGSELLLTVADASGKGISACLYSLGLRSIVRSYAAVYEDLSEIVSHTNNLFCLDTKDSGMFVTAWFGMYNSKTKHLIYNSSGHPAALVCHRDGTIDTLHTPGMALGVAHFKHAATASAQLQAGDLLLLYTDGVTEAHNAKMKLFGKSRLEEILKQHPQTSAKDVVSTILHEVKKFADGAAQHDDIALLAIRVIKDE